MIINNTHVQGIFLYSSDVDYERGDFVVSGDSIYICTASNPTDTLRNTVSGIDPAKDTTGNFKMYPGDKISTAQEYYDYVNNRLYWNYKNTKEEVESALEVEAGTLIIKGTVTSRDALPTKFLEEGDVYRVGTDSTGYEYAYIPYKIDKYISGNVLNQILQDSFFGVNEEGVITNYVYTNTDDEGNEVLEYSIGGSLANIEDNKILNAIMKSPDLNNGMFNVSRALSEIAAYVNRGANTESVLVKQYTYLDTSGGNKRVRIQELVDPSLGSIYYRWSEGISLFTDTYNPGQVYKLNDVVRYSGKSWLSMTNNNSGHQPGSDINYWIEYSGAWAYNNITSWQSTFSSNGAVLAQQVNDIKAYYNKKIAELEATKKQLTGTFCNREVSGISGTSNTATLVARENVRMHRSWDYVNNDETDLLHRLGVSSLSDVFTLVSSAGKVNTYMNPVPLGINIIVKVGTRTNYTYSYSNGGGAWVHGKTLAQILTEFNVTRLSDVFLVPQETYNSLLSLPMDCPFTVIVKDDSSKNLSISLYKQVQQDWTYGRTLFEESDIANQVTRIFFEDLIYNDAHLGTTYNGTVGNTLVVETYGLADNQTDFQDAKSVVSCPGLYGAYEYKMPTLYKSYFAEPIGPEEISTYDSGQRYDPGKKVSSNNITYMSIGTAEPYETPENSPSKWIPWYDYLGGFTWKSTYLGPTGIDKPIDNIITDLSTPYFSGNGGDLWQQLVLGPSPFDQDLSYPRGSIVVDGGVYYRNNLEVRAGGLSPDDPNSTWSKIGDTNDFSLIGSLIPNYSGIFGGKDRNEFEESFINGVADITIDSSKFKWLDSGSGQKTYTKFFCIIYPIFDLTVEELFDKIIKKNSYYAFFDLTNSRCILRNVTDEGVTVLADVLDFYGDIGNALGNRWINDGSIISALSGNVYLNTLNLPNSGSINVFINATYRTQEAADCLVDNFFKCRILGSGSNLSYDSFVKEDINYNNITFFDNPQSFANNTTLGLCSVKVSDMADYTITPILKAKTGGDPKKDYLYYVGQTPEYSWKSIYTTLNGADSWNSSTTYNSGDIVFWHSRLWESNTNNNTGNTPSLDSNVWDVYNGDLHPQDSYPELRYITRITEFRANSWDLSTTYDSGDIVFWHNRLWESQVDNNTSKIPSLGSDAWSVYNDYPVQRDGDIYYDDVNHLCYIWSNGFRGLKNSNKVYTLNSSESFAVVFDPTDGVYSKFDGSDFSLPSYYSDPENVFNDILTPASASEISDTRNNSLYIATGPTPLLSKILNSSMEDIKTLCTLYPKVSYIVRNGSDYYKVNNGSINSIAQITTEEEYLENIDELTTSNTLSGFSTYYTPFIVLLDISRDLQYTEEYRYVFNNMSDSQRKTPANWKTSVGPLTKTVIELAGKPGEWSNSSTYNIGDYVIYNDIVWESTSDNNTGNTPGYSSDEWNRSPILSFITTEELEVLEGYSMPLRTVCTKTVDGKKYYYINGNYWAPGVPPQDDSEYSQTPNYDNLDYPWELPDAFNLGKVWAHTRAGGDKYWHVVQNRSGWLGVNAGSYYDSNRLMNATPWWNNSGSFSSAEEALFDILKTNCVVHPSASSYADRWLGIRWDETISYLPGDIVVDENLLWKCLESNTNKQPKENPDEWAFYGDPLFNTLTYIPSETLLLTSVDPSVPFRVLTKIGSESDYYVTLNTNSADFSDPCITTVLVQQIIDNIIKSYVVTVDLSEEPLSSGINYVRYYITPDLYLDVIREDDIRRVLTVNDPNSKIKNIYYRYKI